MPSDRDRGPLEIRPARLSEVEALTALIERSARALCAEDYTVAQIEGALRLAFGIDSQLIEDGTYYVVEEGRRRLACGGWSFRRTLFGGDAEAGRDSSRLVPPGEAARIRAFFVEPSAARRGLGRLLLEHCEGAARREGFRRFELMATLAGERLYARYGYQAGKRVLYDLGGNLGIEFVPMVKDDDQTQTTRT